MIESEQKPTYAFDGFHLDAQRRVLSHAGGEPIVLAPKVFDTLLYFVERPARLISKRELLEAIWPNVCVEENNLDQAISTLRRTLGERPGEHRFVTTEPGRGYRFVARVSRYEPPVAKIFGVGRSVWSRLFRAAVLAALFVIAGLTGWLLAPRAGPSISQGPELYPVAPPVAARLAAAPEGNRFIAASPDGTRLAYDLDGSVWLQTLGRQDAAPMAKGQAPFFSPDGEWIAFLSADVLMRASVYDHVPVPIAPLLGEGRYLGGSWRDDTIVFATQHGVYRVAANEENGKAELILRAPEDGAYAWPQIMPGSRSVLLTVISGASIGAASIALLDLDALRLSETLLRGAVGARYVSSSEGSDGHLIYATGQRGHLAVREFDPRTRAVSAVPRPIPDIEVLVGGTYFAAAFDVTNTGSLLYVGPRPRQREQLVWIDQQGIEEPIDVALPGNGRVAYPRVSPDGRRVAFDVGGGTARRRIWTMDLRRGVPVQLTESGGRAAAPYEDLQALWSRDGSRIYFTSLRTGDGRIWSRAADGSGSDEQLGDNPGLWGAVAIAPDDRILVFRAPMDEADIVLVDPTNAKAVQPLIESPYREFTPALSPDGRWMAYVSNELGDRDEIFVLSFPSGDVKRRISRHGGANPLWGPDGSSELYYIGYTGSGDVAMMAVTMSFADGPDVVSERELFRKPYLSGMAQVRGLRTYDISPRDGRFVFFAPLESSDERESGELMTIWHLRHWIEAL